MFHLLLLNNIFMTKFINPSCETPYKKFIEYFNRAISRKQKAVDAICISSYNNNLNYAPMPMQQENPRTFKKLEAPPLKQVPRMMSEEEEMELFGIQNNCIRVVKDYVNGGYACDDFD